MKDYAQICRLFYGSTYIPVTHFKDPDVFQYAMPPLAAKLRNIDSTISSLVHFPLNRNPDYYISDSSSFFGYVKKTGTTDYFIIGPVFSTPINHDMLHNYIHEFAISSVNRDEVRQFLSETPQVSFYQFLNILGLFFSLLNNEPIDIVSYFDLNNYKIRTNITNEHTFTLYEAKETQSFHNTYRYEQEFLKYIQNGDPDGLHDFLTATASGLTEGKVADNTLRQAKNIFISASTLVTRAAISGGLDIEQAYHLSDVYIQECEKMQNQEDIFNLQYTMLVDFAERVEKCKIPQGMSREVFECVQFITRHTNEPIQVDDVANHIHRSRSYISKKFKAELGFDVSAFIMRCRLEEAKSLLTHSDKSLIEISSYLCFSSQAYFTNVFKKKYGLTPMQYRNQTRK